MRTRFTASGAWMRVCGVKEPVEIKTAAGGASALVTGMIAWILVTYVPAFHSGLPPTLQTFLPWAVSALLGAAASYWAPHTSRHPPAVPLPDPAMMHEALEALAGRPEFKGKTTVLPPATGG